MRGNWPLLSSIVSRCLPLSPAACFLALFPPQSEAAWGPDGVVGGFDSILPRSNLCAGTGLCGLLLSPVVSRCLPLSPAARCLLYLFKKSGCRGPDGVVKGLDSILLRLNLCAGSGLCCLLLSPVVLGACFCCFISLESLTVEVLAMLLEDSIPYHTPPKSVRGNWPL